MKIKIGDKVCIEVAGVNEKNDPLFNNAMRILQGATLEVNKIKNHSKYSYIYGTETSTGLWWWRDTWLKPSIPVISQMHV